MSTLPFKLVYQAKRKSILCYSLPSCISLCVDETQKRRLWELPAAPSNPGDRFTGDLTINELEGGKKRNNNNHINKMCSCRLQPAPLVCCTSVLVTVTRLPNQRTDTHSVDCSRHYFGWVGVCVCVSLQAAGSLMN